MTWKTQMACQAALAYLFSYSSARITDTSDLWTGSGKDWYDNSAKIGVKNGVPYSKDDDQFEDIDDETLDFGLCTLHFGPRSLDWTLKLAYSLGNV